MVAKLMLPSKPDLLTHCWNLVCWEGEDASRDSWERVANLLHFEDVLRDFERASGTTIPRPAPANAPLPPPPPPPPVPPTCFVLESAEGAVAAQSLVRRLILYFWPDYGWQRGTVAKLSKRVPQFTHVVAYARSTAAFAGTADSLLDAAYYGSRWVLLSLDPSLPVPPPRRARGSGDRP